MEPAQVLLDPAVPLHQVVALPLQAVLPLFRIGDEGFASATFLCNAALALGLGVGILALMTAGGTAVIA